MVTDCTVTVDGDAEGVDTMSVLVVERECDDKDAKNL